MAWMEQENLGVESTHSKLLSSSLQSSLSSSPSNLLSLQPRLLASNALARERRAFYYNDGMAAIDRTISLSLRILQQQRSDRQLERNQLELLKLRNKLVLVAMEQETKGQESTQEKLSSSWKLRWEAEGTQEILLSLQSRASDARAGFCKDGTTEIDNYVSMSRRNLNLLGINKEPELTPAKM
mmetsp:Transcript_6501/g.16494  ORF Transcript_6501/g.16494 Transcript_6501/m.16494 type:complete len:183 (+) Transcript_6501:285-833(+)